MKIRCCFFLSICLVLLFSCCSLNKKELIDKTIFANTWKGAILKKRNDCNKYIGSIENSQERIAVINSLDSIFQTNQINLESIEISNWMSKKGLENRSHTELNIFYEIEINDSLYYRIRFEMIRKRMYVTKREVSTIYYKNNNDVEENDDVREFSYVSYLIADRRMNLQESFVYCSLDP